MSFWNSTQSFLSRKSFGTSLFFNVESNGINKAAFVDIDLDTHGYCCLVRVSVLKMITLTVQQLSVWKTSELHVFVEIFCEVTYCSCWSRHKWNNECILVTIEKLVGLMNLCFWKLRLLIASVLLWFWLKVSRNSKFNYVHYF